MRIHLFPIYLIFVLSATMLTLVSAQLEENGRGTEMDDSKEWRKYQHEEVAKTLPPLAAELFRLHRADFTSPEARRNALRQWNATNGAALREESDALREMERPERERQEMEAQIQFENVLEEQVRSGNLGILEAEFIRLLRIKDENREHRRETIEKWRAEKGTALEAERETRRIREAPALAARQAEAAQARAEYIDQATQSGQIGVREAELKRLQNSVHLPLSKRRIVIRDWMAIHGPEFIAERNARRQAMPRSSFSVNVDPPALIDP